MEISRLISWWLSWRQGICAAAIAIAVAAGCEEGGGRVGKSAAEVPSHRDTIARAGDTLRLDRRDLIDRIFTQLLSDSIAPFDPYSINQRRREPHWSPFLLREDSLRLEWYEWWIASPMYRALQQRVMRDSAMLRGRYDCALLLLRSSQSDAPSLATTFACAFFNERSGRIYGCGTWSDGLRDREALQVGVTKVGGELYRRVDSLLRSAPLSVDEGSAYPQRALIAIATPSARLNLISANVLSFHEWAYDERMRSNRMPRTAYDRRRLTDELKRYISTYILD